MTDNPYKSPVAEAGTQRVPCIGCSKMLHISATTCPECGASQRKKRYKSRGGSAVLAFLLGGFGVHRFYLGQWWGIFYLLFFWTYIPALISLVEMIVFLCTSQQSWDEKYNEGKPKGPGDSSGGVIAIAVVVGLVFFVAIIGILASIALPAYQDYTIRANVAVAMGEASTIKSAVEEFYADNGALPTSNNALGVEDPLVKADGTQLLLDEEGAIRITFAQPNAIKGKTLVIQPVIEAGSYIKWTCTGGDLHDRYRPGICRSDY